MTKTTTGDHMRPNRPCATTTLDMKNPPALWDVSEIARMIGWDRRRMKRLLVELKVAQKIGARWLVGLGNLRAAAPTVYEELVRRWRVAKGDQIDHGEG